MSYQDIKSYVTHLPIFQVMVCRFCEVCIPPKDPFRHYKDNHTVKKNHYVPMAIRCKVAEYMTTLDLCHPQEVRTPDDRVSELKIIKKGFKCNFPGCNVCGVSEPGMRTHYYTHQKHIPIKFKNWEPTALQTFFDGQHRKYIKLFISALMVDISQ
jgi:orsellinic acid/F9775 biosynthesis protein OrsD